MEKGSSSTRAMSDTSAQAESTKPTTSKLASSCTSTMGPLHSFSRMPRSPEQAGLVSYKLPLRTSELRGAARGKGRSSLALTCLLYTSDAADDLLCVDLGGRR